MNNIFLRTRLQLTGLYIGIVVVLLVIFSQIIYFSVSSNIKNNIEGDFNTKSQQESFIQKQISNLQITLLLANGGILLLVGGLSFFLAGKTLTPIRKTFELQKQFLSDASHEFRTPLAILQTNLDNTFREKKGGSKDSHDTKSNLEEVERMTTLVNELLLLSRLEATNSSIAFTKINITELLQTTSTRLMPYAKKKHVLLEASYLQPTPISIKGNQDMVSQAVGNIIKNAIDYNKKHGTVSIALDKNASMAVITISDTGIGIPAKHLPFIFNRFYKGEESRSEHKGTGLGLGIAQDIITKHNGTITIRSSSPKGTVVCVSLPLVPTS